MTTVNGQKRAWHRHMINWSIVFLVCGAGVYASLAYAQEDTRLSNGTRGARAKIKKSMKQVTVADCTGVGTPLTRVPLGTVLPFAGPIDRIPRGWLPCDGRSLEIAHHPELYCAIGNSWGADPAGNAFNIPDLRGLFVRGVDAPELQNPGNRDVGVNQREALKPGGNVEASVGSYQPEATKAPVNAFTAASSGAHSHHFSKVSDDKGGNDNWITAGDQHAPRGEHYTSTDGGHGHNVQGGDTETRPKNVYVNWIIFAPEPQPRVGRSQASLTESNIK